MEDAILIAGPTASGKSAAALDVARRTGGVIVNADSMQVYSVLSALTARPGDEELAAVPHFLYGHVYPSEPYSTGRWIGDVARLIDEGAFADRRPIFVGGTGLYFRALTEGLSPMPDVPRAIREHWRARLAGEGSVALHGELARVDRDAAEKIRPSDGQRIVRALEVVEASGRPIGEWQSMRSCPLVDHQAARCFVLEPDRDVLRQRIERRFDRMVDAGALDEVRALLALRLPPSMPAMKAIGVRELGACLAGSASLETAIADAKTATRRYAKRQSTWFRTQFGAEWKRIPLGEERSASELLKDFL